MVLNDGRTAGALSPAAVFMTELIFKGQRKSDQEINRRCRRRQKRYRDELLAEINADRERPHVEESPSMTTRRPEPQKEAGQHLKKEAGAAEERRLQNSDKSTQPDCLVCL